MRSHTRGRTDNRSNGRGRDCALAIVLGLVLALPLAGANRDREAAALTKLVGEAEIVWRAAEQGNTAEAARQVAVIVAAADMLRDRGRLTEAREQYRRAGLVRPWNFDAKLRYADVLATLGDAEGARVVAEQVARLAETDRELALCARFAPPATLPPLPSLREVVPAPEEIVIGLVPATATERWLMQAVGRNLAALLGVRIGVSEDALDLGAPDRNGRVFLAADLRRTMPWDDPRMGLVRLNGEQLHPEKLSPDQIIELMRTLLTREANAKGLEALAARVAAADKVFQWDATTILPRLRTAQPPGGRGRVISVALVPVDLYAGLADYVFGSAAAEGGYAVVSYARFAAVTTGEPPRSERLVARTTKQLLSSLGFALGVPRCGDPGCARSYPSSLAEHDAKDVALCADCRAGLAKALGRELPRGRE